MVELPHAYNGTHQASPPRTPTTLNPAIERSRENGPYIKSSPPVPPTRHQRSRSYSTVDERFHPIGGSAGTTLQILIDQCDGPAPEGTRPRTAGHQNAFHSLDVQIPHYNLGSPRFSPGGTPFLYGSSSLHLPSTTGEMGSSCTTSQHMEGRWLWPSVDPRSLSPAFSSRDGGSPVAASFSYGGTHRMSSLPTIPQALSPSPLVPSSAVSTFLPIPSPPIPLSQVPANINPEIYDRLSFPPGSEDPTIVRYDARQDISAAAPARIIAQITSAAFVDYHLLSDFFLTYRLFMNARDLATHLIARLRWAIDRGDDTGKVVRVRTFVAIRHWLLNYFADDFVPSLVFRREFVKILNDLTHAVRANGNVSDLKIIGELKKCWRRTCALYWDSMDKPDANVDEDIKPGGPPGTREETLQRPQSTMLRVPQFTTPPPRLDIVQPDSSSGTESFIRDVIQRRAVTMFEKRDGSSKTGNNSTVRSRTRSTVHSKLSAAAPIAPGQPGVRKTSSSNNLSTKHKLSSGPHKRSGSFSDALRDNRYPLPLPNSIAKSTQLLMALPYAGSLVRGNRFPPTPAFVEVIAPSTPVNEFAGFDFGLPASSSNSSVPTRPTRTSEKHLTISNKATNAPGMKRLFGSVRKALGGKSTSQNSVSRGEKPTAVSKEQVARSPSTRSNLSAIETLAANASRLGMGTSGDGKVARVDLLGAGAVDAFQRAMVAAEDIQGRPEGSAAVTSGDEASQDGDLSSLRGLDGPADGSKTDLMAEAGSNISETDEREDPRLSFASQMERKDFLDSPSTISPSTGNPSPQNGPVSMLSGMSFLADESEPDGSRRNSVAQPPPVQRKDTAPSPRTMVESLSLLVRRSKSFSFERTPSPYMRQIGNIDKNSSFIHRTGMDVRSLHSARSFSINRVNSMLSQFSTPMDNISEFSEFRSFTRDNDDILPTRGLLRRRPGGNLRAAAHIGDLEQLRPMSTGSIVTAPFSLEEDLRAELQSRPRQRAFSPATCSSEVSGPRPIAAGVVSLGAMGKTGGATCLQQPTVDESPEETDDPDGVSVANPRTFEAGVLMLRELPDDEDDDGGLEVALAKLEGTYQRKRSGDTSPTFDFRLSIARLGSRELDSSMVVVSEPMYDGVDEEDEDDEEDGREEDKDEGEEEDHDSPEQYHRRLRRRHKQVLDQHPLETPPMMDGNTSSNRSELIREESEDSVPILEKGLTINAFGGGKFPGRSGDRGMDLSHVDSKLETHLESPYADDDDGEDDNNDNASQLSSELSFEMVQQGSATGTFPSATPGTIIQELGIPSHPLRHPPSPPLTLEQALSLPNRTSSDSFQAPRHASRTVPGNLDVSPHSQSTRHTETPRRSRESAILEPTAIHLPFILAYDSELLAKQFTLIEKDALLEVDWKELVELSWSQADTDVKDWVELLNSRDIKGVEVVIARFNLVDTPATRSALPASLTMPR